MAGVDGRKPWDDFRHLQNELELYMKGLTKRPSIIIANKMDLPESEENLAQLKEELCTVPIEILPVSAGTDDLGTTREKLRLMVESLRKKSFF